MWSLSAWPQIEAELSLRLKQEEHQKLTAHMASLRQKLDKMRNKVFELESKRDTLAADQELAVDNLELVVRLTQGQDEIQDQPVTKDYSDAILIDRYVKFTAATGCWPLEWTVRFPAAYMCSCGG